MAVSHIVSVGGTGPESCTATVTAASGPTDGDIVFAHNTNADSTDDPTITDDSADGLPWNKAGTTTLNASLWWKRLSGGDWGSTDVVVTSADNTGASSLVVSVFRGGQSSGDPYDNLSVESNASGNETHAQITPSFADSYLVGTVFNHVTGSPVGTQAFGANSATELFEARSDVGCCVAALLQVGGPSATGAFTWLQGNNITDSFVFAIAPDQGGGAASIVPLLMHNFRSMN